MKSSDEKRKAFVNVFQAPLSKMGFFVKNNVFYKCSKVNRYMFSVEAEIARAGTLCRINIGFGSNFAPIKRDRMMIYGSLSIDALKHLESNDTRIKEDSGRFAIRNDVQGFSNHAEYLLPPFMDYFSPLLNTVTSLSDYLKTEEYLTGLFYKDFEGIEGGIEETTALGYLALGDVENAIRIAKKLVAFHQNRIAIYRLPAENDPFYGAAKQFNSFEENIQRATRDLASAISLAEKIETGATGALLTEIALRDAQSIEACTQFLGERRYSGS